MLIYDGWTKTKHVWNKVFKRGTIGEAPELHGKQNVQMNIKHCTGRSNGSDGFFWRVSPHATRENLHPRGWSVYGQLPSRVSLHFLKLLHWSQTKVNSFNSAPFTSPLSCALPQSCKRKESVQRHRRCHVPHTPSQTHALILFLDLCRAGEGSCAGAFRRSSVCMKRCERGNTGDAGFQQLGVHSQRQISSLSAKTLPLSIPGKEHHEEGRALCAPKHNKTRCFGTDRCLSS